MLLSLIAIGGLSAPIPQFDDTATLIVEADRALFHEAFGGCDIDKLRTLFDDDFRMLHDQAGLVADSADAFVGSIAETCATRDPAVYANKRKHVDGSRRVQYLGSWGVLEEGLHTFHESQNGGPFQAVGRARYIHTWRWTGERFVLLESLSVDHEPYSEDE